MTTLPANVVRLCTLQTIVDLPQICQYERQYPLPPVPETTLRLLAVGLQDDRPRYLHIVYQYASRQESWSYLLLDHHWDSQQRREQQLWGLENRRPGGTFQPRPVPLARHWTGLVTVLGNSAPLRLLLVSYQPQEPHLLSLLQHPSVEEAMADSGRLFAVGGYETPPARRRQAPAARVPSVS